MSTQNTNKPVKDRPTANKGTSAGDQGTDRTTNKGGGMDEKRKEDRKPTATGKERNTNTKKS